jgi:hypothetical protein
MMASPGYQGPFTAGINQDQLQAVDSLRRAGTSAGAVGQGFIDTAGALSGSFGAASDITRRLAAGDPVAQELARRALEDPTQGILTSAGAYANNPFMDGMVDSVSRDITRNLTESQLPSLQSAATAAGGMNSSRAGVVEAILARGAQDRIGDISANLRGSLFNNGLALAASQRDSMFRNALASSGQDIATRAGAAQNFMGLGGAGADLAQAGVGLQGQQAAFQAGAGDVLQAEQQRQIDENKMRFQYDEDRQWEALQRYYGIVGANNWGGTRQSSQTTSTQQRDNPWQTALGVGATIGGLAMAPMTGGMTLGGMAMGSLRSIPSLFGGTPQGSISPQTGVYRPMEGRGF